VYGAMTYFTVFCGRCQDILYTSVRVLAEEAGDDALENDRRERTTDAVRHSSDKRKGAVLGAMSGVWNLPADGLSVATTV